jgi:hypothetical protein
MTVASPRERIHCQLWIELTFSLRSLAERVGFVRLRPLGFGGISSRQHAIPPKLALNSDASEGGWRREWDSNPR